MNRNLMKILSAIAAGFFFIVGIVLIILGIALDIDTFFKVVLIAMGVVSLALTAELGYFTFLMMDTKPNYFLYSSQAKRNISVQKLTFPIVNGRMNRFLSGYAASEGKIWNERVFDNPYLDIPADFKPLIAYKLLYSLAEKDAEAGWACLENSSEETIKFICNGLVLNNDQKFAAAIEKMMVRPVNIKAARDYLVRSKAYMQKKMILLSRHLS